MKRFAVLCAATAIGLTLTACNQMPDTHDADVAAIHANEAQWNQDFASKDADKLAAHYADDAVLMIPGMASMNSKDAIHSALKQMTADPAMSLQFQTVKVDVSKSGELAYTQGTYTETSTNPQTQQVTNDHGSYVTAYRKQSDGSWKAVADISTSEVPPPTPALVPSTQPKQKRK